MADNYKQSVDKINEAVRHLRDQSNPSIRKYAHKHNLPYQRLLRAYNGGKNRSTRKPANTKLNEAQERELQAYCDAWEEEGKIISGAVVRAEAIRLLTKSQEKEGTDTAPELGDAWQDRWLKRRWKAKSQGTDLGQPESSRDAVFNEMSGDVLDEEHGKDLDGVSVDMLDGNYSEDLGEMSVEPDCGPDGQSIPDSIISSNFTPINGPPSRTSLSANCQYLSQDPTLLLKY